MIGKISGIIDFIGSDFVLLDVNGVGYEVYCSTSTLNSLPSPGEQITLFTDLLVRQDLLQLTGFKNLNERSFYRELLTVQGVGMKGALSIVDTIGVTASIRAISMDDWRPFKSAPTIGPKIAQRIVLELKPKIGKLLILSGESVDSQTTRTQSGKNTESKESKEYNREVQTRTEALSALVKLGYSESVAASVLTQIILESDEPTTESLIKESLQRLSSL
ncbi:MAG: Holliday junction branch migration protein RuvA [Rhodobacteraceae bacterium]|nr:Holliday junction branch migration protein RuvA [Paracoccaceae bacterium]MXZ50802.1 Holliday junction branch migration protein RuvA [Paracoccaceae bacterium]MYF45686.1 Holliday junction branch migration protein RuvA [Paracoccaceae bacterium]MYI91999.1 Holliday junction branch migration protein RuvA [Paracoccaceae bacterium]